MKLFKNFALIKQTELDEALYEAEKKAYERAEKSVRKDFESEIEALSDKLDTKKAEIKSLTKKNKDLQAEVDVLNDDRDDVREVLKQKVENDDKLAALEAAKESQDRREANLKDRESKLESKEEGRYKEGYADGVADGVRKINEITAKDRENAMKVAMVAAASHSSPEVVKELTNAKALGSGLTDSED